MATNIDKALYQTPMGLEEMAPEEAIEIEIVDPEEVTISTGDMELTLSKDEFSGMTSMLTWPRARRWCLGRDGRSAIWRY
jgi:hypothetical protein